MTFLKNLGRAFAGLLAVALICAVFFGMALGLAGLAAWLGAGRDAAALIGFGTAWAICVLIGQWPSDNKAGTK